MASVRRTLSPYSDRSYLNGGTTTNNQFSVQSPSHKLIFNTRPNLSPIRRFISGIFLHKQRKSSTSSYFSWKKSIFRCLLFFFIGFLFGMGPFSNDLSSTDFAFETKSPPLITVDRSNVNDEHVLDKPVKETEFKVDTDVGRISRRYGGLVTNASDDDEEVPRKQLIVVTPTYSRALQGYYLNRLGQVLRLVKPQVLWIVIEMNAASTETAEILRNMGIMYRHLVCKKNATDVKDRGVHQRNTALEHIERHRLDGIVYFADDDNIYSLELFESLRNISRFGTWPVGMLAQSKNKAILEGPVCNGSQVIGWHTNEKSKRLRRFHVDMSGFAFNSTILWDPKRWHRPTLYPIRQLDTVKEGFQETTFIEQIVEEESQMESVPLGGCSKIMNWHLHLEARGLIYPKGWILEKNLDVSLPSK